MTDQPADRGLMAAYRDRLIRALAGTPTYTAPESEFTTPGDMQRQRISGALGWDPQASFGSQVEHFLAPLGMTFGALGPGGRPGAMARNINRRAARMDDDQSPFTGGYPTIGNGGLGANSMNNSQGLMFMNPRSIQPAGINPSPYQGRPAGANYNRRFTVVPGGGQ